MRTITLLLCLAATACATGVPEAREAREQAQLTEALAGRLAGAPRNCVNQRDLGNSEGFGETILFRGTGGVVHLSKTRGPCMAVTGSRVLVTYPTGSQLCEGDRVGVVDLTSGASYGSCEIGAFTPYAKPR